VYEQARGLDDDTILQKAFAENRSLVTADKDFGEKIYREHRPHHGVVLLRLADDHTMNKIAALQRLLNTYAPQLPDRYVVVTETRVRFGR
jgi:predicted nuclease of predicted toxin-antitoxin system